MKIQALNGEMAWAIIAYGIFNESKFESVTGITYETRISGNAILYKGGRRNNGMEESIGKDEFIKAFEKIKKEKEINTNTIKSLIPNSLYQKRTPLIGLLFYFGILK
jgi:hypothetical protein